MSDPGVTPAPEASEPTLIQQEGVIPETVVPVEPEQEDLAEAEPTIEATPEAPKPEQPKRTPWYQKRLNELAASRDNERQKRVEAEAKLAAAAPKPEGDEAAPFKPEQFEQLIDQRAQAIVAQREFQSKTKGFLDAGSKEFGAADFTEKCNLVATMGAGDSPEFMQIVTDPDIIPDGHKLIAALADNPEEAERILSLEPMKMAAALTRFASAAPIAEKPLSKAPAPIKPTGGTVKATTAPSESDDMKTWLAKRNATAKYSAGGKPLR